MILPDTETVFTEEYWEPIPPMPEYRHHGSLARSIESYKIQGVHMLLPSIESSVRQKAAETLALAVGQLLSGEPTEAIPEGEAIGTQADFKYALPGAVILIDKEFIMLNGGYSMFKKDDMPEAEIGLSATSCLMKNLDSTHFVDPSDNYAILNPYKKTRIAHGQGVYTREINMYAFCSAKKGETVGLGMSQWRNGPSQPMAIVYAGKIDNNGYIPHPPRVAEAANDSLAENVPVYSRIREARLCIAGVREYAKAKTERRRLTLPRLVPSVAPAGA
ncbi:MAG TPA: hypothetical protein VMR95_01275 [Candidatus Binatia bacterium]|nr:hypothetical protein [Candidatus Binatia bacterium]